MNQQIKDGAVFLGALTHNGQFDYIMARAFYQVPTCQREVFWMPRQNSLLAAAYNSLWARALNMRKEHNIKWFAILHADIRPQDYWLDILIEQAEKHDADVMSAVVAIKETSGVTSTALSGSDNFNRFTRITQKQLWHPDTPDTFDAESITSALYKNSFAGAPELFLEPKPKLLVNTGCFVARLDRPWCTEVDFTINDRIVQMPGGDFVHQVEPEDWYFSRRVAECGGKVMATRLVQVEHMGGLGYKSNTVWGEMIDPATQY